MTLRNLFGWLDPKRGVIKRYFRLLPRRLFQDYGHTGPYTPDQVRSTIARYRIGPPKYAPYALATFCDETALAERPDITAFRRELGAEYFESGAGFTYQDVLRYCGGVAERGLDSEAGAGHGYHGGGDHGIGHH